MRPAEALQSRETMTPEAMGMSASRGQASGAVEHFLSSTGAAPQRADVVQRCSEEKKASLGVRWGGIEDQLDELWDRNQEATLPIVGRLQEIREKLEEPAESIDAKHLEALMKDVESWLTLSQREREGGIYAAAQKFLKLDVGAVQPHTLEGENRDRRVEQGRKFIIWQKQLKNAYEEWERGEKDASETQPEITKFVGLLEGLEYDEDSTTAYDESWKSAPMTGDIEVDSGGKVVGATMSLRDPLSLDRGKIRRRLTVSKARHMWDYVDAETKEPDNSLLPRKTRLKTVESDLLELARDFKARFVSGQHKAAYTYTAATDREYRINKTTSQYPHGYPVRGGDVVPMDRGVFNFLYGVKSSLSTIAKGGVRGIGKVTELTGDDLAGRERQIISAVTSLRLPESVIDTIRSAFEGASKGGAGGDPQARLRAKGKKTKPRKPGRKERRKWNE